MIVINPLSLSGALYIRHRRPPRGGGQSAPQDALLDQLLDQLLVDRTSAAEPRALAGVADIPSAQRTILSSFTWSTKGTTRPADSRAQQGPRHQQGKTLPMAPPLLPGAPLKEFL